MSKLKELRARGQSIWLDYMKRSLITSGEIDRLIEVGLLGRTSNPSIFEKAIAETSEYDIDLRKLARGSLIRRIRAIEFRTSSPWGASAVEPVPAVNLDLAPTTTRPRASCVARACTTTQQHLPAAAVVPALANQKGKTWP